MKVGFFTAYRKDPRHYVLAVELIRSIRETMPGVPIVQFTDETSPPVTGIDELIRKTNGKLLERRQEHYSECVGDWLFLDTDTVVRKDVQNVFDDSFDIAIADRNWPHIPQLQAVWTTMPYNDGVVFSRSQEFWRLCLDEWRKANENDWCSEQRAVYKVIRSGRFRVKILPGMVYNYPPKELGDACKGVSIAHYKGIRKAWMLVRRAA